MEWQVNSTYRDKGSWQHPDDQFMRLLHNGSKTIANAGGIRWQNFVNIKPREVATGQRIPPYIVLLTAETSVSWANPWSDVVSYSSGEIIYWGDARLTDDRRTWDNFRGNKLIWAINHLRLRNEIGLIPPFLHFKKNRSGEVRFSGLCRMKDCSLAWYDDAGSPILNLRIVLDILDTLTVDPTWLVNRSLIQTGEKLLKESPKVWLDAMRGRVKGLRLWRSGIRSQEEQLPGETHADHEILRQIRGLDGYQFERLTVGIIELLPEIISGLTHRVEQTKRTGDGGIDLFGFFRLPEPIDYLIVFKGEAKNWGNAVRPKDVSRLVARLQRGEHGLFFTTSWYTKQAQEEVLQDGYPVRLFSGQDIVNILKRTNKVSDGEIDREWLSAILS